MAELELRKKRCDRPAGSVRLRGFEAIRIDWLQRFFRAIFSENPLCGLGVDL